MRIPAVLLVGVLLVAACGGGGTGGGAPQATVREVATVRPTADALSPAQRNALAKAQEYLDYTAFSASGLVAQLEYEGFEKAVAQEAVASLDVDWQEQAHLKALEYLDYSAFSLSGLIDQLEYEGFPKAQAQYGATKAYGQ
jgi:colicin import membrane protein